MVAWRGNDRNYLRLASTGYVAKSIGGLDFKVSVFLRLTALFCFSIGTLTGANLHTLRDFNQSHGAIEVRLISMPLHDLSEIEI